MTSIFLEICVDSLRSADEAVGGGADRLEVCGSLPLGGGVTPSLGLIRAISQRHPRVPLMVMVRPRVGDFVYSQSEIEVMLEDIAVFKQEGVAGIVLGVLTREGEVDAPSTTRLVNAAKPLDVTFHRAFDMTLDPFTACTTIASINGTTRILTSGHSADKLSSALPTFIQLQKHLDRCLRERAATHSDLGPKSSPGAATPALKLIPGSGINPDTIRQVVAALYPVGIKEYHLSGGSFVNSDVGPNIRAVKSKFGMGDWSIWHTRAEVVREVRVRAEDCLS